MISTNCKSYFFKELETQEKITVQGDLPKRWYMTVGKLPECDAHETSTEPMEERFCVLNDIDMLILQQNEVMEIVLHKWNEELVTIRKNYTDQSWNEEVTNEV